MNVESEGKANELTRFTKTLVILMMVFALGLQVFFIAAIIQTRNEREVLLEQYGELYQEFVDQNDEQPDAPSPEDVGVSPEQGPIGLPGLEGPAGEPGEDGRDATDSQVREGVVAYCNLHAECRGPAGQDSTVPGPQGSSGASGRDGQNATAEQIASAVAAYCAARNECQGPAGQNGANGINGTNGADGAPGPAGPTGPAPASFTYEFLGIQYTCVNSGDGNYVCSPS